MMARLAPVALVLALGACGSPTPAPTLAVLLGTYRVQVAALGRSDPDGMTAVQGSGSDVLLEFVTGISEVRCQLGGGGALTLPPQRLVVDHSTGSAEGQATGEGSLGGGAIDLTIHLVTTGLGSDAGDSAPIDYRVTGSRQ